MKLQRFKEFISVNESQHKLEIDVPILVLIDNEIYYVEEIEVDVNWQWEPADPGIGIPIAGYAVEDYRPVKVTSADKLIHPGLKQKISDLIPPDDETTRELKNLGLVDDPDWEKIVDIALSGDFYSYWKKLGIYELPQLSARFIRRLNKGSLNIISGETLDEFKESIADQVRRLEPQPGSDYDDHNEED